MAQQALPPGAIRRRAVFGMLDADGWSWAGVKATFWFLTTIFLLGYIPNLVYYATVADTVEVGANFISPINWCPASNEDLPCPAPAGSVVPWQSSPAELALPEPRHGAVTVQSGTNLYLVGGTAADGSVIPGTLETVVTLDGNFQPWTEGPALPEPRTEAAYASLTGVPYVIGGYDAAGKPTDTVFVGVLKKGKLTGWALADGKESRPDLKLPVPLAGASAVAVPNGIWLAGGMTTEGITTGVWRAALETGRIVPSAWKEMAGLATPEPRVDAALVSVGDHLYLIGGSDTRGASRSVFRLHLVAGEPAIDTVSQAAEGWSIAPADQSIPAPRARASTLNASGTIYVVGGVDGTGALQYTTLWAIADVNGNLSWHYLDQSNLTSPVADASAALVGATAFLIGGEDTTGALAGSWRGNIAPEPPFFRLGLFGATLPALSIKGEIGQQLGYINAMTVGMINFGLLVAIGLAFSHRRQTLLLFEKVSRGRFKALREDEFTPGA